MSEWGSEQDGRGWGGSAGIREGWGGKEGGHDCDRDARPEGAGADGPAIY